MKNKTADAYDKKIVKKPWGFEYTIFRNLNKLAVTYVNILPKKETSLHCHPSKTTGFIILNGSAKVQIGIGEANAKVYKPSSSLMIRPGLFHSLKNVSKSPLVALEFETPADKKDLVRFKDLYGRKLKPYEGQNKTQLGDSLIFFKKPTKNKSRKYLFNNMEILLENYTNYRKIFKGNNSTIIAIIDGKIVNNEGKQVIGYGEIVKPHVLKKLSSSFKIHKNLILMKVTNKKANNHRKNTLVEIN